MKTLIKGIAILGVLSSLWSCNSQTPKANEVNFITKEGWVDVGTKNLEKLGVFVKDTAVVYNNKIEGVGSLDLTIHDRTYLGNSSGIEQTNLAFYPRYITTLDTIQRTMYMLAGNQSGSEAEAYKWQSFESLVPILVKQKTGDYQFGETLIFWMTKTPELEKLIQSFRKE